MIPSRGVSALRATLAGEGGAMAAAVRDEGQLSGEPGASPAAHAAAGPRAAADPAGYELLLEMIQEGTLLHYEQGRGRVLAVPDPDLALLLGDRLYALGLGRLAALGDVAAVGELGETIALLAQAHLRQDLPLAAAAWRAGAAAVGWGAGPELRSAQALARAGHPGAAGALQAATAAVDPNTRSGDAPDRRRDTL
jgi:hypothetical protein